jgi:AcrR family transcriptional regulator
VASTHKRIYRLKARADRQRQTRERIVAATAALHEKVGPARTTIADIARAAGVQRLTVYNTFPRLRDLFGACQVHFLTSRPPPNLEPGVSRKDPLVRLEEALTDFYSWYRENESMERHVNRDRHLVPELDSLLRVSADARLDAASAAYAESIGGTAVRSVIRIALDFGTWALLAGQGMTDPEIADLMRRAVTGVANQPPNRDQ